MPVWAAVLAMGAAGNPWQQGRAICPWLHCARLCPACGVRQISRCHDLCGEASCCWGLGGVQHQMT